MKMRNLAFQILFGLSIVLNLSESMSSRESIIPLNFKDGISRLHSHKRFYQILQNSEKKRIHAQDFDLRLFLKNSFEKLSIDEKAFNLSQECSMQLSQLSNGLANHKEWSLKGL